MLIYCHWHVSGRFWPFVVNKIYKSITNYVKLFVVRTFLFKILPWHDLVVVISLYRSCVFFYIFYIFKIIFCYFFCIFCSYSFLCAVLWWLVQWAFVAFLVIWNKYDDDDDDVYFNQFHFLLSVSWPVIVPDPTILVLTLLPVISCITVTIFSMVWYGIHRIHVLGFNVPLDTV